MRIKRKAKSFLRDQKEKKNNNNNTLPTKEQELDLNPTSFSKAYAIA